MTRFEHTICARVNEGRRLCLVKYVIGALHHPRVNTRAIIIATTMLLLLSNISVEALQLDLTLCDTPINV